MIKDAFMSRLEHKARLNQNAECKGTHLDCGIE